MATFAELESAGKPDVLVPGKAHVVRALDARSVNTRYGDKMVRNLILNDGSADLRASWWNPADLDSDLAGRKVELIAFRKDNKNAGVRTTMGQDQQGNPRLELTASGGYLKLLEEELPGISEPTAPVQTGAPAQQPVEWPADPLGTDVPERKVDAAHRHGTGGTGAVAGELVPVEPVLEPVPHAHRVGRIHAED